MGRPRVGGRSLSALLLIAALGLAGCLGASPPDADAAAPGRNEGLGADEASQQPLLLTWEGYVRAGAAMEVPGHIEETSGAFRPVWSMSFQLHVGEAPGVMEVTLAWAAPAARLILMVTEPFDQDAPTWYESPATDQSPICFAIPPDTLRPGVWRIMAHSQVAVDVALSFEVAMRGGNGTIVDEPSHAPATAFPFIVAEAETPTPLPCEAA